MGCARLKTKIGEGFICGPGIEPCKHCGQAADYLCDWPTGKGETCDIVLCEDCAMTVGENQHLCQIHHKIYRNKKVSLGVLEQNKITKWEL